jgi:hypothetical protein
MLRADKITSPLYILMPVFGTKRAISNDLFFTARLSKGSGQNLRQQTRFLMRSISEVTGANTLWGEHKPAKQTDFDTEQPALTTGIDGKSEPIELNPKGYTGPLGELVSVLDDGPGARRAANDNAISGKAAHAWPAMTRARSGTLMNTVFENLAAESVLCRGRHLFDLATVGHDILPFISQSTEAESRATIVLSTSVDSTVVELNGDVGTATGFQAPDYRTKFGPKYAPSDKTLAAMTPDEYKRTLGRMPTLHEQRYVVPRGSSRDKRPVSERRSAAITLSGKVKCRSGRPTFNPQFDEVRQHTMVEAQEQLDLLRWLMTPWLYEVFDAIAFSSATCGDIGEQAGFTGKQAEAVGLDRSRMAILTAISAFELLDSIQESEPNSRARNGLPLRPPISLIKKPTPGKRLAA